MTDRTIDPTLRELLDVHSEAWFSGFHAPILGRVQTYNLATQLADVEPLVILRVEGLDVAKSPILRGVPVAFPGGALTSYAWPLQPGDPLELIPQSADFGTYWASGTVGLLPGSKRRMSLSDCIAVPVRSLSQASPLPAAAWAADGGVLFGLHYIGSSAAILFAALDTDQVVKGAADPLYLWMTQVEAGISGGGGIPPSPSHTAFNKVGNVVASSTKLKAQ